MTKYGYVCRTDFVHEFGEILACIPIYPSLEELKKHRKCVSVCGWVKVKLEMEEEVLGDEELYDL